MTAPTHSVRGSASTSRRSEPSDRIPERASCSPDRSTRPRSERNWPVQCPNVCGSTNLARSSSERRRPDHGRTTRRAPRRRRSRPSRWRRPARPRSAGMSGAPGVARRMSQRALAARVGLSQAAAAARSSVASARARPLETWIALRHRARSTARRVPESAAPARAMHEPADAGHLRIQEHILRLATATGRPGHASSCRPDRDDSAPLGRSSASGRPRHATQHPRRVLEHVSATSAPPSARTTPQARRGRRDLARRPHRRPSGSSPATAANRALLARYPHIIEAAFPGSSRAWIHALSRERAADEPGLVWFDPATARLREHRRATIRS